MASSGVSSTALLTRCLLLAGAVLVIYIIPQNSTTAQLSPKNDLATTGNATRICKSVDIRNSIKRFELLRGCQVVEGFVQILLFDNIDSAQLSVISFPELREITDFLLLYRVNGLRTLANLFPNLAVIRGQNTFFNHALVLFEMPSLQEIGLYSLTDVMNGYIRIDKNPQLCFLNTINWDLITHDKGENFIKNIKPDNECPLCPGDSKEKTDLVCPKARNIEGKTVVEGKRLCWNRQRCQKVCPDHCRSCNSQGKCCDPNCLGGCGEKINECHVCKNITIGIGNEMRCAQKCPAEKYEYLGRRCISREECLATRRPVDISGENVNKLPEYPYKIFNRTCTLYCPANYMEKNQTCIPCEGRCKKECPGTNIDTIQSAEELRGCTHITGSIEIQIRGGKNVVSKLEENLNMIEEIDGYIKIVRSFPLITLNFLKNLRVIHGKTLESEKYVFVLLDNQNLQELWEDENKTIEIKNGRLFFHFNPKLCLYKIRRLQQMAKIENVTELEVATNSNGDKIACHVQSINVSVVPHTKGAVLSWEAFKGGDYRKLLGYVVYCVEAPYQNVTLYDRRDACGGDGWKVDDITLSPNDTSPKLTYPLAILKPFTQYAFYVKTLTLKTEKDSAQSEIQYFTTLPDEPSKLDHVEIVSNSSDSLYIVWQPPKSPNGNISHYIITGKRQISLSVGGNDSHDCSSTQLHGPEKKPGMTDTHTNKQKNDTCVCENQKQSSKTSGMERERYDQISFENALQNAVYTKRANKTNRSKRSTNDSFPIHEAQEEYPNDVLNETETATNTWKSFKFYVYGRTDLYVNKLKHYSYYDISIQVCRKALESGDQKRKCSKPLVKTNEGRTRKKVGADDILFLDVFNKSSNMVTVTWKEPADPNGRILSYQIECKRTDLDNAKPFVFCISHEQFLNTSRLYTVDKLGAGNYSLRVIAISQAGTGSYSHTIYFCLEEQDTSSPNVVVIAVIVAIVVIITIAAVIWYKRRQEQNSKNMKLIPKINPDYDVYVPDEWEVPRKKIELLKELGQGSFGMVYEGIASDIRGNAQVRCAIKTVNEHATNRERIEFLNEAAVMKAFDTHHVVRLLGVVSQGQPTLVVMELMANGDLKSYLRSHRPDVENFDPSKAQPPTLKRILQMAIEIADGMAYLTAKKFVHRDLAARNCMVAEDLTVKIGDFGMTRDIYETDYYRKGTKGLLPVRWMAPESLKDGVFTSSSDVWSYGVVLWEMATLASQPYQGLSNDQVLRYVIDGGIMEMPENCPDKLYKLMRNCWRHKPTDRPSFLELCTFLLDDANPTFSLVSFYHSPAGVEARNTKNNQQSSQNDSSTPLRIAHDLDENFSITSSDHDSDLDIDMDTRIDFPSYPMLSKDSIATVNGYVTGHATNGTAT